MPKAEKSTFNVVVCHKYIKEKLYQMKNFIYLMEVLNNKNQTGYGT